MNDFYGFQDFIQGWMEANLCLTYSEHAEALQALKEARSYKDIKDAVLLAGASDSSGEENMLELIEEYYILA